MSQPSSDDPEIKTIHVYSADDLGEHAQHNTTYVLHGDLSAAQFPKGWLRKPEPTELTVIRRGNHLQIQNLEGHSDVVVQSCKVSTE